MSKGSIFICCIKSALFHNSCSDSNPNGMLHKKGSWRKGSSKMDFLWPNVAVLSWATLILLFYHQRALCILWMPHDTALLGLGEQDVSNSTILNISAQPIALVNWDKGIHHAKRTWNKIVPSCRRSALWTHFQIWFYSPWDGVYKFNDKMDVIFQLTSCEWLQEETEDCKFHLTLFHYHHYY